MFFSFVYLYICIFSFSLFGAKERIVLIEDQSGKDLFVQKITKIELPSWVEVDYLVHQFIEESFPRVVKNIKQTELEYTADERANDLKMMIESFREIYGAIESIEDKRTPLLKRGLYFKALISNFIALVERFNLLLRNRWYVGTEQLGRKSVTYKMMAEVLNKKENQKMFKIWFQFSDYVFSFLNKYKKIDLSKNVGVTYFSIPKSTWSSDNTSFLLGYIKMSQGYYPFVLDKEEEFESYSIPFLTEDGVKSYAVQAEKGVLTEESMLLFAEDVKDGNNIITIELIHGMNSSTPLMKEYVGMIPQVNSLQHSSLKNLRKDNLGCWRGYLVLPQMKQQRAVFKLLYLELLKETLRSSTEKDVRELSAFVDFSRDISFYNKQKTLSFEAVEDELAQEDSIELGLLEAEVQASASSSSSSLVSKEVLDGERYKEEYIQVIDQEIAKEAAALEAEIMEDLQLSEKAIGDFRAKKGKGKEKGKQRVKKQEKQSTEIERLKQKAAVLIESYKVQGRIKMREWQSIFNDLSTDVQGLKKEIAIVEGGTVLNITGSHSTLHSKEGTVTLVRPHGSNKDNAFSSKAVNSTIEEYVSVQFLKHLESVLPTLE